MKNIYCFRQMITALTAFIFLIWAFFKNNFIVKIIISPFIICSFAIFFERLFLLLNKEKLSNIFKYLFRISFFIYYIGFLLYAIYYTLVNKTYSLFIVIFIFILALIPLLKKSFIRKNKQKPH